MTVPLSESSLSIRQLATFFDSYSESLILPGQPIGSASRHLYDLVMRRAEMEWNSCRPPGAVI